jgi:hypothetical protein
MADDLESQILDILKKIQADVASLKDGLADIAKRAARDEEQRKRQRRDSAAILGGKRRTASICGGSARDFAQDVRWVLEHESRWPGF